jgi:hypothetical protein
MDFNTCEACGNDIAFCTCPSRADLQKRIAELERERDEARERVAEMEEYAWDALLQACDVSDDQVIDNMCMSTWESLCAYFATTGKLEDINGRLYMIRARATDK